MDKPTKDIAEHIITRLQYDAHYRNQTPIGRVQVLFGTEKKEETLWIMRKERAPEHSVQRDITGYVREVVSSGSHHPAFGEGHTVFRDSPVGRIIMDVLGPHIYKVPKGNLVIESLNKAAFSTSAAYGQIDAINARIELAGSESRFASLVEALKKIGRLRQKEQELQEALEEQQKQIEVNLDKQAEELRNALAATRSQIKDEVASLARFRNEEIKLRDQPVLDAMQEDVKRSNLLRAG